MIKQERIEWISAARGIGIFLVVFGHVWRGLESSGIVPDGQLYVSIDNAIYLFHMPLFFVLSGMLFERTALRDDFVPALLKRSEQLLYPLVLWSYITAAFLLIAGSFTNRSQITVSDALTYPLPPKDIYWFLAALFLIQTLAWLVVRSRKKPLYFVAFLLTSAVVFVADLPSMSVWVRNTIENAPLFFVGLMLAGRNLSSRWLALGGLVVFALTEAVAVLSTNLLKAPSDFLPGVLATVSVIAVIAWIFSRREGPIAKAIGYLGQASMTIYVSHIIALAAVRIALTKVGITSAPVHLIIGVTAGIGLPLVFHVLATKLGLLRVFGLGRDSRDPKPSGDIRVSASNPPAS